jgi:hypothetical protein
MAGAAFPGLPVAAVVADRAGSVIGNSILIGHRPEAIVLRPSSSGHRHRADMARTRGCGQCGGGTVRVTVVTAASRGIEDDVPPRLSVALRIDSAPSLV